MRDLVSKLRSQNAALEALHEEEAAWASGPTAAVTMEMRVGELKPEEEAWLDQEYVATVKAPFQPDSSLAGEVSQATAPEPISKVAE